MAECIFCKIIEGKIPATKIAESDGAFAFADINPTAPVHALVIPKKHIATMNDVDDWSVMAPVFELAARVAREQGLDKSGWRAGINTGRDDHPLVLPLPPHLI